MLTERVRERETMLTESETIQTEKERGGLETNLECSGRWGRWNLRREDGGRAVTKTKKRNK